MPLPITRGRPADWRVGPQSRTSALQLRAKLAANRGKPCEHRGCDRVRKGISPYCAQHRQRLLSQGDPTASLPSANALKIIGHALRLYLDMHPALARRIDADLGGIESRQYLPPSFRLRPSDCHAKLPQVARAAGLKANWLHTDGRTYAEAMRRALCVKAWVAIAYDGDWRNRQRFLETQCGAIFGHFHSATAQMQRLVGGGVRRSLGRELIRNIHAAYGPHFWSSAVETVDGQQLTLLDYARSALAVAGLLKRP